MKRKAQIQAFVRGGHYTNPPYTHYPNGTPIPRTDGVQLQEYVIEVTWSAAIRVKATSEAEARAWVKHHVIGARVTPRHRKATP